ncbi:hypothetical protein JLS56_03240 [Mycoplasma mycoides subsp. capri]|uniref:hypothetical protein n=1 Tax=Mycoplasma mycoides TaxID=2102 RepID=UPI001AF653C5|nr:hypothetical protein JLS56_03240 [Mycoplasma mycoides subsp. capri]
MKTNNISGTNIPGIKRQFHNKIIVNVLYKTKPRAIQKLMYKVSSKVSDFHI